MNKLEIKLNLTKEEIRALLCVIDLAQGEGLYYGEEMSWPKVETLVNNIVKILEESL